MSKKNKNTIYILYSLFLTENGEKIVIGGIQKYILGLINVFSKNYHIKIIQRSSYNFYKKYDTYQVLGFQVKGNKNLGKQLYKNIENSLNPSDYVIWASDRVSFKISHKKTIAIQHGITFDFIDYANIKFGSLLKKNLIISIFYRFLQYLSAIKYFLRSSTVICVDYNYLNWIRTVLPRRLTNRVSVIPNYSEIPNQPNEVVASKMINIIFARRFFEYRGVYILCEIIENLSKKHDHIKFGIYGDGPLESYMINRLKNYSNVSFSKFSVKDALKIPMSYNISLIPTFGSEGTSLSLLESMACYCVPIVSNVGGLTNVILDGYNGFLVNPTANEFCEKIEFLINNKTELKVMGDNARKTIEVSFSFMKWKSKWEDIIKMID